MKLTLTTGAGEQKLSNLLSKIYAFRYSLSNVCFWCFTLLFLVSPAWAQNTVNQDGFLVQWNTELTAITRDKILTDFEPDTLTEQKYYPLSHLSVVANESATSDSQLADTSLQTDSRIATIQPDYIYKSPVDGVAVDQPDSVIRANWWLYEEVAADSRKGIRARNINPQEKSALDLLSEGQTVNLALLDSGVDTGFPDFRDRVVKSKNLIGNNDIIDTSGMGTYLAGLLAGTTKEDTFPGLVPNTVDLNLYSGKITCDTLTTSAAMSEGLRWAIKQDVRLAILAFYKAYSKNFNDTILHRHVRGAKENDIYITAPAGNDSMDKVGYPAQFDEIIAVTATGFQGDLKSNANYDKGVELAAPGLFVYLPAPQHQAIGDSTGAFIDGTVVSPAMVSGVAALLLSENPGLTQGELRTRLNDAGVNKKWQAETGWGKIDALTAVRMIIYQKEETNKLVAYPNPFSLTEHNQITFRPAENIGAKIAVTIFSVNGHKLTEVTGQNKATWNGKINGKPVPPGTYLYYAKGPSITQEGVFTVINW